MMVSMGRHKPETKRRLQAEYRARNRQKLREKSRQERAKLRQEMLDVYGDRCAFCGFNDKRALQLDHIANNGAAERKEAGGGQSFAGWQFYKWLRGQNWSSGYQVLCANCNLLKYAESKVL